MTPKKAATFRIDEEILQALNELREATGISVSDQVDRALQLWLQTMGVAAQVSARRQRMQHLETVRGIGEVVEEGGKAIGPRKYHLTVWQAMHRVPTFGDPQGEVEGLKSVEGTVQFDQHESFSLVGKSLVLTLEDGRRFPFFLQSTSGNVAARGALQ